MCWMATCSCCAWCRDACSVSDAPGRCGWRAGHGAAQRVAGRMADHLVRESSMSVLQRRLYFLAIGLGLIYLALLPLKPYPLGWLLKPLPMLLFALLMWRAFPGAAGRWLGLGFIGAAAGDFFLDFGDRDGLFLQALLSFLVNQIAFVVAFYLLARGRRAFHWRSLPALLYAGLLAMLVVAAAGALQVPVAIYLGCLLLMVVMACRVEVRSGPLWLVALLFMVADSLIGLKK